MNTKKSEPSKFKWHSYETILPPPQKYPVLTACFSQGQRPQGLGSPPIRDYLNVFCE